MITIFIECEGEDYELLDSLTVGRHLDNDIVVAGEEILDYHARLERVDRGVKVHPLLDATLSLEQQDFSTPLHITPMDILKLGQTQLTIRVEDASSISTANWSLRQVDGSLKAIQPKLTIGRAEDADLTLEDDHISRFHAKLTVDHGAWLQDLRSANGTFVNGERVVGGVRLFHGDLLSIDTHRFQLCCDGADLTPIKPFDPLPPQPYASDHSGQGAVAPDITEFGVEGLQPTTNVTSVPKTPAGAHLVGASDPVSGQVFPLAMGTTSIGRDTGSTILLDDSSVSAQHAELVLRAEGLSITNLIATNGTKVNDKPITTATLEPGDRITLGRVQMLYQHQASSRTRGASGLSWFLLAASLVVAAILTWFW